MHQRIGGLTRRQALLAAIGLGAASGALPGCSLGVMFNRMLSGDPLITAEFRQMTGVDLTKGKHKLVVVCTTPSFVEDDLSTLKIDLIDGVTRRLRTHGVDVIDPDDVATWIDDHGSLEAVGDLAQDFDVEYIAWIDISQFSFYEENSQQLKLLRGRCSGHVRAYAVEKPAEGMGKRKFTSQVYQTEFNSIHPRHQPLSETGRSALLFQKEYVNRICDFLAEKFYDHRPGNDI